MRTRESSASMGSPCCKSYHQMRVNGRGLGLFLNQRHMCSLARSLTSHHPSMARRKTVHSCTGAGFRF